MLILTKRYSLSCNTFITIGLFLTEALKTRVRVFLGNKNDFFVPLSEATLASLFDYETKRKIKSHFANKNNNTPDEKLDENTTLKFINLFEKAGLLIWDEKQNVKVSFLQQSWENLSILGPVIKCYRNDLDILQQTVKSAIIQVKSLFEKFFYTSTDNLQVVKNILKSTEFDNLIELELITQCYKRFITSIDIEKNNVITVE